jgi:hypothetical protein
MPIAQRLVRQIALLDADRLATATATLADACQRIEAFLAGEAASKSPRARCLGP